MGETLKQLPTLESSVTDDIEDQHDCPELQKLNHRRETSAGHAATFWDAPDLACDMSQLPPTGLVAMNSKDFFCSGREEHLARAISQKQKIVSNSELGQIPIIFHSSAPDHPTLSIDFSFRYHHLSIFSQIVDQIIFSTPLQSFDFEPGYDELYSSACRGHFYIFPVERGLIVFVLGLWSLAPVLSHSWQIGSEFVNGR